MPSLFIYAFSFLFSVFSFASAGKIGAFRFKNFIDGDFKPYDPLARRYDNTYIGKLTYANGARTSIQSPRTAKLQSILNRLPYSDRAIPNGEYIVHMVVRQQNAAAEDIQESDLNSADHTTKASSLTKHVKKSECVDDATHEVLEFEISQHTNNYLSMPDILNSECVSLPYKDRKSWTQNTYSLTEKTTAENCATGEFQDAHLYRELQATFTAPTSTRTVRVPPHECIDTGEEEVLSVQNEATPEVFTESYVLEEECTNSADALEAAYAFNAGDRWVKSNRGDAVTLGTVVTVDTTAALPFFKNFTLLASSTSMTTTSGTNDYAVGQEIDRKSSYSAQRNTLEPAFTVTAWVKGHGTIFSMASAAMPQACGRKSTFLIESSGQPKNDWGCSDTHSSSLRTNTAQWTHVAFRYNGYGQRSIVIDGIEQTDVSHDTSREYFAETGSLSSPKTHNAVIVRYSELGDAIGNYEGYSLRQCFKATLAENHIYFEVSNGVCRSSATKGSGSSAIYRRSIQYMITEVDFSGQVKHGPFSGQLDEVLLFNRYLQLQTVQAVAAHMTIEGRFDGSSRIDHALTGLGTATKVSWTRYADFTEEQIERTDCIDSSDERYSIAIANHPTYIYSGEGRGYAVPLDYTAYSGDLENVNSFVLPVQNSLSICNKEHFDTKLVLHSYQETTHDECMAKQVNDGVCQQGDSISPSTRAACTTGTFFPSRAYTWKPDDFQILYDVSEAECTLGGDSWGTSQAILFGSQNRNNQIFSDHELTFYWKNKVGGESSAVNRNDLASMKEWCRGTITCAGLQLDGDVIYPVERSVSPQDDSSYGYRICDQRIRKPVDSAMQCFLHAGASLVGLDDLVYISGDEYRTFAWGYTGSANGQACYLYNGAFQWSATALGDRLCSDEPSDYELLPFEQSRWQRDNDSITSTKEDDCTLHKIDWQAHNRVYETVGTSSRPHFVLKGQKSWQREPVDCLYATSATFPINKNTARECRDEAIFWGATGYSFQDQGAEFLYLTPRHFTHVEEARAECKRLHAHRAGPENTWDLCTNAQYDCAADDSCITSDTPDNTIFAVAACCFNTGTSCAITTNTEVCTPKNGYESFSFRTCADEVIETASNTTYNVYDPVWSRSEWRDETRSRDYDPAYYDIVEQTSACDRRSHLSYEECLSEAYPFLELSSGTVDPSEKADIEDCRRYASSKNLVFTESTSTWTTNSLCNGWASGNECSANPTYMWPSCKKECASVGSPSGCVRRGSDIWFNTQTTTRDCGYGGVYCIVLRKYGHLDWLGKVYDKEKIAGCALEATESYYNAYRYDSAKQPQAGEKAICRRHFEHFTETFDYSNTNCRYLNHELEVSRTSILACQTYADQTSHTAFSFSGTRCLLAKDRGPCEEEAGWQSRFFVSPQSVEQFHKNPNKEYSVLPILECARNTTAESRIVQVSYGPEAYGIAWKLPSNPTAYASEAEAMTACTSACPAIYTDGTNYYALDRLEAADEMPPTDASYAVHKHRIRNVENFQNKKLATHFLSNSKEECHAQCVLESTCRMVQFTYSQCIFYNQIYEMATTVETSVILYQEVKGAVSYGPNGDCWLYKNYIGSAFSDTSSDGDCREILNTGTGYYTFPIDKRLAGENKVVYLLADPNVDTATTTTIVHQQRSEEWCDNRDGQGSWNAYPSITSETEQDDCSGTWTRNANIERNDVLQRECELTDSKSISWTRNADKVTSATGKEEGYALLYENGYAIQFRKTCGVHDMQTVSKVYGHACLKEAACSVADLGHGYALINGVCYSYLHEVGSNVSDCRWERTLPDATSYLPIARKNLAEAIDVCNTRESCAGICERKVAHGRTFALATSSTTALPSCHAGWTGGDCATILPSENRNNSITEKRHTAIDYCNMLGQRLCPQAVIGSGTYPCLHVEEGTTCPLNDYSSIDAVAFCCGRTEKSGKILVEALYYERVKEIGKCAYPYGLAGSMISDRTPKLTDSYEFVKISSAACVGGRIVNEGDDTCDICYVDASCEELCLEDPSCNYYSRNNGVCKVHTTCDAFEGYFENNIETFMLRKKPGRYDTPQALHGILGDCKYHYTVRNPNVVSQVSYDKATDPLVPWRCERATVPLDRRLSLLRHSLNETFKYDVMEDHFVDDTQAIELTYQALDYSDTTEDNLQDCLNKNEGKVNAYLETTKRCRTFHNPFAVIPTQASFVGQSYRSAGLFEEFRISISNMFTVLSTIQPILTVDDWTLSSAQDECEVYCLENNCGAFLMEGQDCKILEMPDEATMEYLRAMDPTGNVIVRVKTPSELVCRPNASKWQLNAFETTANMPPFATTETLGTADTVLQCRHLFLNDPRTPRLDTFLYNSNTKECRISFLRDSLVEAEGSTTNAGFQAYRITRTVENPVRVEATRFETEDIARETCLPTAGLVAGRDCTSIECASFWFREEDVIRHEITEELCSPSWPPTPPLLSFAWDRNSQGTLTFNVEEDTCKASEKFMSWRTGTDGVGRIVVENEADCLQRSTDEVTAVYLGNEPLPDHRSACNGIVDEHSFERLFPYPIEVANAETIRIVSAQASIDECAAHANAYYAHQNRSTESKVFEYNFVTSQCAIFTETECPTLCVADETPEPEKEGFFAFRLHGETGLTAASCWLLSVLDSRSTGNTYCRQCPLGKHSARAGSNCLPCQQGRYADETGLRACKSCPEGKFQFGTGETHCHNCPAGSYQDISEGKRSCKLCAAGKYEQDNQCVDCPVGKSAPNNFQENKAGDLLYSGANYKGPLMYYDPRFDYSDVHGVSFKNADGTYMNGYSPIFTVLRKFQMEAHDSPDDCVSCGAGFYSDESGATECKACEEGYFSDQSGSTSCTACNAGRIARTDDAGFHELMPFACFSAEEIGEYRHYDVSTNTYKASEEDIGLIREEPQAHVEACFQSCKAEQACLFVSYKTGSCRLHRKCDERGDTGWTAYRLSESSSSVGNSTRYELSVEATVYGPSHHECAEETLLVAPETYIHKADQGISLSGTIETALTFQEAIDKCNLLRDCVGFTYGGAEDVALRIFSEDAPILLKNQGDLFEQSGLQSWFKEEPVETKEDCQKQCAMLEDCEFMEWEGKKICKKWGHVCTPKKKESLTAAESSIFRIGFASSFQVFLFQGSWPCDAVVFTGKTRSQCEKEAVAKFAPMYYYYEGSCHVYVSYANGGIETLFSGHLSRQSSICLSGGTPPPFDDTAPGRLYAIGNRKWDTASKECAFCPAGLNTDVAGATICRQCRAGSYDQNPQSDQPCMPCESGRFQDEPGQSTCKACSVGRYQDEQGTVKCKASGQGYRVINQGFGESRNLREQSSGPLQNNTYVNALRLDFEGATDRKICGRNSFANGYENINCKKVPVGAISVKRERVWTEETSPCRYDNSIVETFFSVGSSLPYYDGDLFNRGGMQSLEDCIDFANEQSTGATADAVAISFGEGFCYLFSDTNEGLVPDCIANPSFLSASLAVSEVEFGTQSDEPVIPPDWYEEFTPYEDVRFVSPYACEGIHYEYIGDYFSATDCTTMCRMQKAFGQAPCRYVSFSSSDNKCWFVNWKKNLGLEGTGDGIEVNTVYNIAEICSYGTRTVPLEINDETLPGSGGYKTGQTITYEVYMEKEPMNTDGKRDADGVPSLGINGFYDLNVPEFSYAPYISTKPLSNMYQNWESESFYSHSGPFSFTLSAGLYTSFTVKMANTFYCYNYMYYRTQNYNYAWNHPSRYVCSDDSASDPTTGKRTKRYYLESLTCESAGGSTKTNWEWDTEGKLSTASTGAGQDITKASSSPTITLTLKEPILGSMSCSGYYKKFDSGLGSGYHKYGGDYTGGSSSSAFAKFQFTFGAVSVKPEQSEWYIPECDKPGKRYFDNEYPLKAECRWTRKKFYERIRAALLQEHTLPSNVFPDFKLNGGYQSENANLLKIMGFHSYEDWNYELKTSGDNFNSINEDDCRTYAEFHGKSWATTTLNTYPTGCSFDTYNVRYNTNYAGASCGGSYTCLARYDGFRFRYQKDAHYHFDHNLIRPLFDVGQNEDNFYTTDLSVAANRALEGSNSFEYCTGSTTQLYQMLAPKSCDDMGFPFVANEAKSTGSSKRICTKMDTEGESIEKTTPVECCIGTDCTGFASCSSDGFYDARKLHVVPYESSGIIKVLTSNDDLLQTFESDDTEYGLRYIKDRCNQLGDLCLGVSQSGILFYAHGHASTISKTSGRSLFTKGANYAVEGFFESNDPEYSNSIEGANTIHECFMVCLNFAPCERFFFDTTAKTCRIQKVVKLLSASVSSNVVMFKVHTNVAGDTSKAQFCSACSIDNTASDAIQGAVGVCSACEPGFISSTSDIYVAEEQFGKAGQEQCQQCPSGMIFLATLHACVACPIGFACPKKGSILDQSAVQCGTGEYSTSSLLDFVSEDISSTASLRCGVCSAGKYANEKGAQSCEKCPKGYFSLARGKCQPCPLGTYTLSSGSEECFAVDSQSFIPWPASTLSEKRTCTTESGDNNKCGAGERRICTSIEDAFCTQCDDVRPGHKTYPNPTDPNVCIIEACGKGFYSPNGCLGDNCCLPCVSTCKAGQYSTGCGGPDDDGMSTSNTGCADCPVNTYTQHPASVDANFDGSSCDGGCSSNSIHKYGNAFQTGNPFFYEETYKDEAYPQYSSLYYRTQTDERPGPNAAHGLCAVGISSSAKSATKCSAAAYQCVPCRSNVKVSWKYSATWDKITSWSPYRSTVTTKTFGRTIQPVWETNGQTGQTYCQSYWYLWNNDAWSDAYKTSTANKDAPAPAPAPTPSPSPSPSCFPSVASVETPEGKKAIYEIDIGDFVLSHEGFSEVYLLGHADNETLGDYVRITTDNATSLRLSAEHFILSNGRYVYAKDVKEGDRLAYGETVKAVEFEKARGLWNPFTLAGTIVVDGILASCHSEWFLEKLPAWMRPSAAVIPSIYQILMAPARNIYERNKAWVVRFTKSFDGKAIGEHSVVEVLQKMWKSYWEKEGTHIHKHTT